MAEQKKTENEEFMTKITLGDEIKLKDLASVFTDLLRMGFDGDLTLTADVSMFQFVKDMYRLHDQYFLKHAQDLMNAE